MTQIQIIGAIMYFTGMRPAQFAESKGVNTQTLYRVIKNKWQTQPVREAIAEATGLSIDELWPEKEKA